MKLIDAYVGNNKVARMYHKDAIVYPSPIKDGLVLWYDFLGVTNTDDNRDVAEDLSDNGNDGELFNFAYEQGSGYDNGLVFDGVDDNLKPSYFNLTHEQDFTIELFYNNGNDAYSDRILYNTHVSLLRHNGNRYVLISGVVSDSTTIPFELDASNNNLTGYNYISLTYDKLSKVFSIYQDGIKLTTSYLDWDLIQFTINRVGPFVYSGRGRPTTLYSYKVYDKTLSQEEVTHNYQIEKERWNL